MLHHGFVNFSTHCTTWFVAQLPNSRRLEAGNPWHSPGMIRPALPAAVAAPRAAPARVNNGSASRTWTTA
jgi:hypothetical protein